MGSECLMVLIFFGGDEKVLVLHRGSGHRTL